MTPVPSLVETVDMFFAKNRLLVQKIVIIFGVLIFSITVASGIALGYQWQKLIVISVLGLIVLLAVLKRPALGLILTMIGGFFVSLTGPGGLNFTVFGVVITLGIWILGLVIIDHKIQLVSSSTIPPLLILILVSCMSFGIGQLPWFQQVNHAPLDAQLGGFAIFLLSAGTFISVPHLIHDLRWLEWITWIFIILGGIYVTGRITEGRILDVDRYFQNGAIAQSMFWVWLASLTFSQALFNRSLKPAWRIILGCLVVIIYYVATVLNYSWKSGWFPALVSVVVIIAIWFWHLRLVRLVSPLLIIAVLIGLYFVSSEALGTEWYSWATRLEAWSIVIQIAMANPILGLGFSNYHWYTPLIPFRGYNARINSHSQFVDIFAQTGILGLICYLWFFWEVGNLAWWLRDRAPDGFARAYVYGVLGGLAGTLVASALVDWVLPFVYNIGLTGFRASILVWIFLGGLVVIEQKVRHTVQPLST
jgi:hypothetical protein